jgi:serine/threonine protein kinase
MNKYTIHHEIAKGCFGQVMRAQHNKTGEWVAIKMEETGENKFPILKHEVEILNWLFQKGCRKIPPIYWFGVEDQYNCLIMPYYEHSLKDYFLHKGTGACNRIAQMLFTILQDIHSKWVVHRDIKPENFMIRAGEIYMIDFGLATFFTDDGRTHRHDERTDTLVGTPKYTSINIHIGHTYSRRDDIIAIGYMMMEFEYTGTPLPWSDECHTGLFEGGPEEAAIAADHPDIHILHPVNIYRQYLKSEQMIAHWLGGAAAAAADDTEEMERAQKWREYFCMTYAMEYPDKPKYAELAAMFPV